MIVMATVCAGHREPGRRNMLWVSGHGEGWALYAERLMRTGYRRIRVTIYA